MLRIHVAGNRVSFITLRSYHAVREDRAVLMNVSISNARVSCRLTTPCSRIVLASASLGVPLAASRSSYRLYSSTSAGEGVYQFLSADQKQLALDGLYLQRHQSDVESLVSSEDDPPPSSSKRRRPSDAMAASPPAVNASTVASPLSIAVGEETGLGGDNDGDGTSTAWEEPNLADIDRSIPQVDCEFIASLIRSRYLRRRDFLQQKEALQERVEDRTKLEVPTVAGTARMSFFGALHGETPEPNGSKGKDVSGLLAPTNTHSPVPISTAVLETLTDEEKDLLRTMRPEYDDGFVLLDCRTVNEVTSWGIIEGAKVLPAHELFEAFHSTPEDFRRLYGFNKPRPDEIIVCYCQYGPRSLMAAQILSWMGYLKVMHFRDGYYEWGKQYNLLLRRWMEHDKESGNELRRLATFQAALEMQRAVAPEFNALPMKEARQYELNPTRSRGKLLVGEGLRVEAYAVVAQLVEGLVPPALPGVLDPEIPLNDSSSTGSRLLGEQHLARFLEQATGVDPTLEISQEQTAMDLGEAQAAVVDALAYGHELGVSPDTAFIPAARPPR